MESSPLQNARYAYATKLPSALRGGPDSLVLERGAAAAPAEDQELVRKLFPSTYGLPALRIAAAKSAAANLKRPLKVGVILSGGPAPGGHNVIAGLFDGLKAGNPESKLCGFRGGPGGLVDDRYLDIDKELVDRYRNTGGFDLVGSGRTKIETPEQFEKALATALRRNLDAVVVVGGDDSNTNAALLAEYFAAKSPDRPVAVIGVPKTIDGDLKNQAIEASFGFDTASKLYAELVGNICRDSASGRKYWHFIKLMGRSASHICLECALQTRPNVAFISEEVEAKKTSLAQIVETVVDSVRRRSEQGENFGVVLVPEGLVEFVPEFKKLMAELNELLAAEEAAFKALPGAAEQRGFVHARLTQASAAVYARLPPDIAAQLCADRDPHGNVQVSKIETEKLIAQMTQARLEELAAEGAYKGSFSWQNHFFGYEGRCAFPSNFDADYCYSLGYTAFVLAASGCTGYIASIRGLERPAEQWEAGGLPLSSMMNMERRKGQERPVIRKALVDLEGKPFRHFASRRGDWALSSDYRVPGGIQYFGPAALTDSPTVTLILEKGE